MATRHIRTQRAVQKAVAKVGHSLTKVEREMEANKTGFVRSQASGWKSCCPGRRLTPGTTAPVPRARFSWMMHLLPPCQPGSTRLICGLASSTRSGEPADDNRWLQRAGWLKRGQRNLVCRPSRQQPRPSPKSGASEHGAANAGCSRCWWRRSPSRSGRLTAACAMRRSAGLATTRRLLQADASRPRR